MSHRFPWNSPDALASDCERCGENNDDYPHFMLCYACRMRQTERRLDVCNDVWLAFPPTHELGRLARDWILANDPDQEAARAAYADTEWSPSRWSRNATLVGDILEHVLDALGPCELRTAAQAYLSAMRTGRAA